jgi:hypothetical protein
MDHAGTRWRIPAFDLIKSKRCKIRLQGGYLRDDSTADGHGSTWIQEGKDPSFKKMQV